MSKSATLILVLAVGVGAYVLGGIARKGGDSSSSDSAGHADKAGEAAGAPADGIERYRVPLDGASKGSTSAKVNIVAFSDFQCPFCSRVTPTMDRIEKEYGKDVRFFFRHNPLPFHQDAPLASQAAIAAESQGKFWQMHDKLFANQQNLKRPELEKYAQEIGLDMGKFKAYLDSNSGQKRIDADMALARQIGVQGTPNFFINGRPLYGAASFEKFKEVIDAELEARR